MRSHMSGSCNIVIPMNIKVGIYEYKALKASIAIIEGAHVLATGSLSTQ